MHTTCTAIIASNDDPRIAFDDINNSWWNFFWCSCVHIRVNAITFDTNKPISPWQRRQQRRPLKKQPRRKQQRRQPPRRPLRKLRRRSKQRSTNARKAPIIRGLSLFLPHVDTISHTDRWTMIRSGCSACALACCIIQHGWIDQRARMQMPAMWARGDRSRSTRVGLA